MNTSAGTASLPQVRFLLFSLTRSGSNSLTDILNSHPEIRCINEPFDPNRFEGKYRQAIIEPASLKQSLDVIWQCYNGIKHAWVPHGWPFLGRPEFNKQLLLSGSFSRVLFLTRKNILQRLVSAQIQRQSKLPSIREQLAKRDHLRTFQFAPLDRARIADGLAIEQKTIAEYRKMLSENNVHFLPLQYEDLHAPALTVSQKLAKVNEILAFLGFEPLTGKNEQHVLTTVFAQRTRLSGSDVYRLIPDIETVEKEFGSDETGWLFRE